MFPFHDPDGNTFSITEAASHGHRREARA